MLARAVALGSRSGLVYLDFGPASRSCHQHPRRQRLDKYGLPPPLPPRSHTMSGRDEASPPHDDPISPSSFVEHIRELGEKRDREDQERNRLLEEQILQGRAERAARRAGVYYFPRALFMFGRRCAPN